MTPETAQLLNRLRREIADWQRDLDDFNDRDMRLINGADEDISDVFVEKIRRKVEEMQALVEKHDPDGFTVLR